MTPVGAGDGVIEGLRGSRTQLQRLPGGGYAYNLLDEAVRIELRYLRRESHQLHAEVDVQCDWAGVAAHKESLSCADLNLSSQTARKTLAKYCAEQAKTKPDAFDWMGPINAACLEVIAAERNGDGVIVLDDAPELTDRDFEIVPGFQVPADAPSMDIAPADGLKSLVQLFSLGTLARRGLPVLYLDWEWSADRHKQRKQRLFGSARIDTLHYMRCRAPLEIECDRIRRYCDAHGIAFLGVDSVGLAANGKLNDDDTAIRFHRALATLPPSLCAAHVAKSFVGADVRTDPLAFGSVFFTNLCRQTWVVKKQPGATENIVTIGLFSSKQNHGERLRPVGLEFTFSPDRIDVWSVDLLGVEGLAERMPLQARMVGLLKRGPLTFADIATQLDAKVDSVVKAANRGKAFTKVTGHDGINRIALIERHVA